MRPLVLAIGLMLGSAGSLAAQDGYYLGYGGFGPEFGLIVNVGRGLRFEPGVYLGFDRYSQDTDSLDYKGHNVDLGLAARLQWVAAPAMVTPTAALGVAVGKEWQQTESDYLFGPSSGVHSETKLSPMEYTASVQAGVELQVSNWAGISFEYALRVRHLRGTETQITDSPFLYSNSSSPYRYTEVSNALVWTVRLFPKGRSPEAPASH